MKSPKNPTLFTNRQIKATSKRLAKLTRQLQEQKQLTAIERLLDEEFDSLAAAKRELKRNTIQVKRTTKAAAKQLKSLAKVFAEAFRTSNRSNSKQASKSPSTTKQSKAKSPSRLGKSKGSQRSTGQKTAPGKSSVSRTAQKSARSSVVPPKKQVISTPVKQATPKGVKSKAFSIRQLKPRSGETLLELLDRLEALGPEADKMLKPGEKWIFTYGKGQSKRAWSELSRAVRHMRGYQLTGAILDAKYEEEGGETENDLVTSIGFLKTTQSYDAYERGRFELSEERRNERRRLNRAADKMLSEYGIVPTKFGGVTSRLEGMFKINSMTVAQKRAAKKKGKK